MSTNLPRIVGLNGLKRSGKDTIGSYLVREHGYTRLSFAAPLYEAVYRLNPIIGWHYQGWEPGDSTVIVERVHEVIDAIGWEAAKDSHQYGQEVRRLLEHMGTEVGRELFGQDFWVELAEAQMLPDKRYVFTDARFLNEFETVSRYKPDAYLLKVIRPGLTPNGHASDRDWPNGLFDGSVMNDDTIPALESRVLDMLRVGR